MIEQTSSPFSTQVKTSPKIGSAARITFFLQQSVQAAAGTLSGVEALNETSADIRVLWTGKQYKSKRFAYCLSV